ncbi:MAG TPA: NAD(P)H-dependent oxidoreductase [Daejeonella sp.]|nr:NAD(P)H-dependent oxidoreductase [Daejeonella sp.]
MSSRTVLILGSSRSTGNTSLIVDYLKEQLACDLIDLNNYQMSYYDYTHDNAGDDYLTLMRTLTTNYDLLILATPVYWYSMSGIMKVFLDRLTDLLDMDKDSGRKLRGKKIAIISTSLGGNLGDSFWLPFMATAKYLGMEYAGNIDINFSNPTTKTEGLNNLEKFASLIKSPQPA